MTVILTPEQEATVMQQVGSGRFNSPEEVVSAALRLMREQDELRRIRLEELKREIQIGIDEADRGESQPLDIEALRAEAKLRLEAASVA